MKTKILSNSLIYLSLLFLVIYLYREGAYRLPEIHSWLWFTISLALLLVGHIFYVLIWQSMLAPEFRINWFILFESESITIFNKYIPGKIWVVVGPATYLRKFYDVPLALLSNKSLYMQIMILWSGLLFAPLYLKEISSSIAISCVALFTIFTIYLLGGSHKLLQRFIDLLGLNVNVAKYSQSFRISTVIYSIVLWVIWSIAFYTYVFATTGNYDLPILIGFIFPVASVIGIAAIFAPGGIGIREGVMVLLLVAVFFAPTHATEVAINSRIWFLIYETVVFGLSLFSIAARSKMGVFNEK